MTHRKRMGLSIVAVMSVAFGRAHAGSPWTLVSAGRSVEALAAWAGVDVSGTGLDCDCISDVSDSSVAFGPWVGDVSPSSCGASEAVQSGLLGEYAVTGAGAASGGVLLPVSGFCASPVFSQVARSEYVATFTVTTTTQVRVALTASASCNGCDEGPFTAPMATVTLASGGATLVEVLAETLTAGATQSFLGVLTLTPGTYTVSAVADVDNLQVENGPWMDSSQAGFSVAIEQMCAAADLDDDGTVDASDLAALLGAWGLAGAADLDTSGSVGASDLSILLAAWGGC